MHTSRPIEAATRAPDSIATLLAVALVLASTFAVGCRTAAPSNRPVDTWSAAAIADRNIASPERSGKVLLAVTFSGGGTRAAAFAYGALSELAETEIQLDGRSRRLSDEIDLISSVSGGSFTAAYYGLHGDRIFDDFEEVFLRRNVQRGLALELLRPRYWLGFLGVDRSQLAARYYDRTVFHGATFADIEARPGAPQIVINATDLSTAARFPFIPFTFGRICSDYASYPVSEAVTASSAVPIVFSTVRLRNHEGRCDFALPPWLAEPATDEGDLRALMREEILAQAASLHDRPYIHLLDGGLSDNLGLANSLGALAVIGDYEQALREMRHENLELILVVTVNAETETKRPWDRSDEGASAVQVVSGLSGAQIGQQNRRTMRLAQRAFGALARDLSTPEKPVHFRFVEASFRKVADPEERRELRRIETSFDLSDREVDRLIEVGRRLVGESPELADALTLLGETKPTP